MDVLERKSLGLSHSGKGKLLFEESPEELEEKIRKRRRFLRASGFGLAGYVVFSMIIMYVVVGGASNFYWWFLVVFVGLTSFCIAFLFYESKRTFNPVRIHENGIDMPMGHRSFFLSFGEIKYMKEHSPPLGGKPYITFKTVGLIGLMFMLKRDMAGLEPYIGFMRRESAGPSIVSIWNQQRKTRLLPRSRNGTDILWVCSCQPCSLGPSPICITSD